MAIKRPGVEPRVDIGEEIVYEEKVPERRPFAIYDWSPSLTKQSFADEVNINNIIERARQGQDVSNMFRERIAQFGDFTEIPSYQESMNFIRAADEAFMSLDARVRERFNNDPNRLFEFLEDSNNYDEAVKLGLVEAKALPVEPESSTAVKTSSDVEPTKPKASGGKT